jgi:hypothetical protein
LKLAYTRKVAFNINGTTIHSALVIPLNKNCNEFKKTINDGKMTL